MIPGAPNPLMWGQGDPLDELGIIARSLRFRNSATAYLSRTPGSVGNRKTLTYSAWVKRSTLSSAKQDLFISGSNVEGQQSSQVYFEANDTLSIYTTIAGSAADITLNTSQVFRDPSAHMHILVAIDTTQATASNRVKLYINGSQVTSFLTATYPAQNLDTAFNNNVLHTIGRFTNVSANPFDGYISQVAVIDGQALSPSSFGQIHPRTGQWRPKGKSAIKALVDAGGTNSFFLAFDDPTNTTTIAADSSSKGNNWTAVNISLTAGLTYDSMLDTPTANYCTANPLIPSSAVQNGGLTVTGGVNVYGTVLLNKGAWYFEATVGTLITNTESMGVGIVDPTNLSDSRYIRTRSADMSAKCTTAAETAGYPYPSVSDVFGIAFDIDNNIFRIFKNGSLVAESVGGASLSGKYWLPVVYLQSAATQGVWHLNFGQRPFSYTPPTGFKALCTKNLPYPLIKKSSNAFAAVTDSGANIAATLAVARSGWTDYIDIFKRRDAAEGWRWRFSDDPANYIDSSSTAAKAAFPSLTGTSYVGYVLKVSAANGIATGRLTHTNGTPSVVTDGLANSRKAIILKNEADTSSWYFYHPDLTAGKLLYLEQVAGETTDATINTVTASGFTVAAALASGTYRWISLAEVDGFLKLGKFTGNGSADGPAPNTEMLSRLITTKRTDAAASWRQVDSVINSGNPMSTFLHPNLTNGDGTAAICDDLSNGFKVRTSDVADNASAGTYVYLTIAAAPFRYANAR